MSLDDHALPKRRLRSATADDVRDQYRDGRRSFRRLRLDGANLARADLSGAVFLEGSFRGTNFAGCNLAGTQFKFSNARGADFSGASFIGADLMGANFQEALFRSTDFTGSFLQRSDCRYADFVRAQINNTSLRGSDLAHAKFRSARLTGADLSDLNLGSLCEASSIEHRGPSTIDARSVMRSYSHPRLKRFMTDCGVPPLFSEYMIACAEAETKGSMRALMQSTFISYGGPDQAFARRFYDALRSHQVSVFFFPESARLGERIDAELYRQLKEYDRVILICSANSLNRPGVLHEIREVLDRESRDGAETYLLPITIDDYLFSGWADEQPDLAERLKRRVVGDFRSAMDGEDAFDQALSRVIEVLRAAQPTRSV